MRLSGETVFCRGMRLSAESQTLFDKALQWIPGGVNSPVRAFRAVGGNPFFAVRAKGASVWDADDNEYVDYVGTWGPAILGHAPHVARAPESPAPMCQRSRRTRCRPHPKPRHLSLARRKKGSHQQHETPEQVN